MLVELHIAGLGVIEDVSLELARTVSEDGRPTEEAATLAAQLLAEAARERA